MPRNPLTRARIAAQEIERHRAAQSSWADERAAAIRDAIDAGMSRSRIARELGISPQAVTKILGRVPLTEAT